MLQDQIQVQSSKCGFLPSFTEREIKNSLKSSRVFQNIQLKRKLGHQFMTSVILSRQRNIFNISQYVEVLVLKISHCLGLPKIELNGARGMDDLAVKSTCCRGLGFSSQHPPSGLHLTITSVP